MEVFSLVGGKWVKPGRQPLPTLIKARVAMIGAFGDPATPPVDNGFNRDTLAYGTYFPDDHPEWVGPNPGIALTTVGGPGDNQSVDVLATKDGDIIENKIIYGRVMLGSYSNVIVRNCVIYSDVMRGSQRSCVQASGNNYRGARIVDCRLTQRLNNHNEWANAVFGGNFTIERCEVDNQPDGVSLNLPGAYANILGCWIHDGWYNEWPDSLGANSGGTNNYVGLPIYSGTLPAGYYPYAAGSAGKYTHADGIQFYRFKTATIRGNSIGGVHSPIAHNTGRAAEIQANSSDYFNSCIILKQEGSSSEADRIDTVLVEYNRFEGGESSLNIVYNNGNAFPNVTIQHNRFVRATWSPAYYVYRWRDPNGVPIAIMSDNVFDDDGSAVTITRGN